MDTATRYYSVSKSLEDSVKQMKAIRQGILPKKNWREFLQELQDEDKKDI